MALLGYWGRTDHPAQLEQKLAHALSSLHAQPQAINHFFQSTSMATGLARWGVHARAGWSGDALNASLSAAALPNETDISVSASASQLTLARNEFGCGTLFWTEQNGIIWFASHLQGLLPLMSKTEISVAAAYGYACFSYVPAPLTPLNNVFAVSAGSVGEFRFASDRDLIPTVNWTKPDKDWREAAEQIAEPVKDEVVATNQLQTLLTDSMQAQLADQPNEPVGVFLSGGLDSSIAAALLVRAGARVKAFTLDFGEYGVSEMQYAEQVAAHLKIPLVKVVASPKRVLKALNATAQALDMPYGDGVTVPLYLLNQAASQECAVVFNGEGGDQLFAGWTNKPLIAADIYQAVHPQAADFAQDYLRTFHRLHGYEQAVFSPAALAETQKLNPLDWLSDALDGESSQAMLHRLRRANLMLKGAQNIQPRASNLSMACGLAVRSPFNNRALARWTFSVAPDLFLREAHEKYLLKRAVEIWLPSDIVWREKRGMGVPLSQWCLGPLWRALGEWLQPATLRAASLWQADLALRLAAGTVGGQLQGRRIGESLWLLLMWQVWQSTVLKQESHNALLHPFLVPAKFWQWQLNRE